MKKQDVQYLLRAGQVPAEAKQAAIAVLGGGLNADYWQDEIALSCDVAVRKEDRIEGYKIKTS